MAKVGFSPLGLDAGSTEIAADSGEKIGVAAGARVGLEGVCGGATGADSSIRLFFLHPPQTGWQGGMPVKV
jgi:hypothetical protein